MQGKYNQAYPTSAKEVLAFCQKIGKLENADKMQMAEGNIELQSELGKDFLSTSPTVPQPA